MNKYTVQYRVWKQHHFYEVLRWSSGSEIGVVIQTNIPTRDKAEQACKIWQDREATKHGE